MMCEKNKQFLASRGSVLIEYAFLLPALLLFILGIMDMGRLIWTQTTLERAVEAAARCGVVDSNNCGTTTQIQNYAVAQAYGLVITNSAFTVATVACGIQVTGQFVFNFVVPWMSPNTMTLSSTSCYPL